MGVNSTTFNRIVHVSAASPFMDDSTYQETMLANAQRRNHPFVAIVATNIVFEKSGELRICRPARYNNNAGVQIIRFDSHRTPARSKGNFLGLYRVLKELQPDFIMDHGFCIVSAIAILLYKRSNPDCKVVADSHMTRENYSDWDLGVGERVFNFLLRVIGKSYFRCCEKVYGITSQTVEMINNLYGVPSSITEVLPLGYNDALIDFHNQKTVRNDIRNKLGISDKKLVLVHGGKLAENKKTLELVRVVKSIPDVTLLVFGDFLDEEYELKVKAENSVNAMYLGYLTPIEIYNTYLASDIAVFPGRASCLRQEAVACGLPIISCLCGGDEDINIIMSNNGIALPSEWWEDLLKESIKEIMDSFERYKESAYRLSQTEYKKFAYSAEAEYVLDN